MHVSPSHPMLGGACQCLPLLSDAMMPFILFCNGILVRPADFCSNILLDCFRRGCFFWVWLRDSGHPNLVGPTVGLLSPSALQVPCVPNP